MVVADCEEKKGDENQPKDGQLVGQIECFHDGLGCQDQQIRNANNKERSVLQARGLRLISFLLQAVESSNFTPSDYSSGTATLRKTLFPPESVARRVIEWGLSSGSGIWSV